MWKCFIFKWNNMLLKDVKQFFFYCCPENELYSQAWYDDSGLDSERPFNILFNILFNIQNSNFFLNLDFKRTMHTSCYCIQTYSVLILKIFHEINYCYYYYYYYYYYSIFPNIHGVMLFLTFTYTNMKTRFKFMLQVQIQNHNNKKKIYGLNRYC